MIKEIFREIDLAIESTKSDVPVAILNWEKKELYSKFYKKYMEIKKRYLKDEKRRGKF